jgi:hypothetical protein
LERGITIMVTAILIPIICIYFYWVTKKELKEHEERWLNLTNLNEEAIVTGEIIHLTQTKKRYYYHRYISVIQIKLQTETKLIQVKRITPYKLQNEIQALKTGDKVRLYGNWEENEFRFLRYEFINE